METVTAALALFTFFTLFDAIVCKADETEDDSQNTVPPNNLAYEGFPPQTGIIFSTVHDWIVQESQFYEHLTVILPKVKNHDLGWQIESYLDIYDDEVVNNVAKWAAASKLELDIASVSWHPFLIFKTLRRLSVDYPALYHALNAEYPNQVPDFITTPPSESDVMEYGILLVSLAYLSSFKISDFCLGTFGDTQTNITLSAAEAIILAESAFTFKFYSSTLEFLLYARNIAIKTGEFDPQSLQENLQYTVVEHDVHWNSQELPTYDYYTRKIGSVTNYLKNPDVFTTQMNHLKANHRVHNATEDVSNIWKSAQYQLICNGKNFQTEEEKKSLKCWYQFGSEYILPYKMELLNRDPWVIKVYQLIDPSIATPIKRYLVATALETYAGYMGDEAEFNFQKNFVNKFSAYTRFPRETPDPVLRLERKVSSVSNQDAMTPDKENLHASCSLPGALFAAHDDSHDDYETMWNGRLTTTLIYMGNTIQGGHTMFHKLGFSVEPEPYSAILWANRKKNGRIEHRNYHGGCPVVLGDKWLSNKWILGNIQQRRCSKDPEE